MIATCRAWSALVTFMLAIPQQNYVTEKHNYFKASPVFQISWDLHGGMLVAQR
jgi:hypothetical protein